MGYRNYLLSIPKEEYDLIKNMTCDEFRKHYEVELDDEDDIDSWYVGTYEFGKSIMEFSKRDNFNLPKDSYSEFFLSDELKNRYSDDEVFVVNKKFIEYLLEYYSNIVRENYKGFIDPFISSVDRGDVKHNDFLNSIKIEYSFPKNKIDFDFTKITDEEKSAFFHMFEYVMNNARDWGLYSYFDKTRPYDISDEINRIVGSNKYEYLIFELTHIYKTFDWENNVMYYNGY